MSWRDTNASSTWASTSTIALPSPTMSKRVMPRGNIRPAALQRWAGGADDCASGTSGLPGCSGAPACDRPAGASSLKRNGGGRVQTPQARRDAVGGSERLRCRSRRRPGPSRRARPPAACRVRAARRRFRARRAAIPSRIPQGGFYGPLAIRPGSRSRPRRAAGRSGPRRRRAPGGGAAAARRRARRGGAAHAGGRPRHHRCRARCRTPSGWWSRARSKRR